MANAEKIIFYNTQNFLFKVENFFPRDVLLDLRRDIEDELKKAVPDILDERMRSAQKVGIAPDRIRLEQKWYKIWREADFSVWPDEIKTFDQIIYPPQIRRVSERDYFVPWHQDEAYIGALGPRGHKKFMVCFLPLEDSLKGRPTVQFCDNRNQKFVEHTSRPGFKMNQFDIQEKDIPKENQLVTVDVELGDVLLFGSHILHRTYCERENIMPRLSMEFRFTDKASLLSQKDYFDARKQEFYFKE